MSSAGRPPAEARGLLTPGGERACPLRARSTGTQRLLGVASGLNDFGLDLRKRLIGVGSGSPHIRLENLRLQRSSIASLAAELPRARSRTPVESGSRPELRI